MTALSTSPDSRNCVTYGIKGMAAYADHALILGKEDDEVCTPLSTRRWTT